MQIRFRYKLTFLIFCLITVLLSVSFLVVQNYLQSEFVSRIEKNLDETKEIVSRLMSVRQRQLEDYSLSIRENNLILTMIRDAALDQVTRNDIIQDEVLPNYPDVDAVIVTDANGQILASNKTAAKLVEIIGKTPLMETALEGEYSSTYLFIGKQCIQVVGEPFFDGGEMTHIVFVGMLLDQNFVEEVKRLSGIDIVFLKGEDPFLSTDWNREESDELLASFAKQLMKEQIPSTAIKTTILANERYLYTLVMDKWGFSPSYALSQSLDEELRFVEKIRQWIFLTGSVGTALALFLSFIFSLGVSRPINDLKAATKAIKNMDYKHRVNIQTRDEFSELGHSFNLMIQGLADKERIRGVMNKVVSKEIAEELLQGDIQLGGEERPITILFSDIRGFTSLAEGMQPAELLNLLNQYFTHVNTNIEKHNGVIDKYIGDAVMALFGAPVSFPDQTSASVKASLDIIHSVSEFNHDVVIPMGKQLKIGIGLNTGTVVTGNMGAESRLNYTAIGDEVNLASRIEGLCKYYGVPLIISDSTFQGMNREDPDFARRIICRQLDSVQVQGKVDGACIYEVMPLSFPKDQAQALADDFKKGRQALLHKEFGEGERIFREITKRFPFDEPSQLYLARCERYREDKQAFDREYRRWSLCLGK